MNDLPSGTLLITNFQQDVKKGFYALFSKKGLLEAAVFDFTGDLDLASYFNRVELLFVHKNGTLYGINTPGNPKIYSINVAYFPKTGSPYSLFSSAATTLLEWA